MSLTRFTIEVDGMTIEGEGVVQVHGAPTADPMAAVVDFLDQIDPQALEAEVLQRMGWGDACQTAKTIQLLRALATGEVAKL
jgi:cephalosporin-C deacetylase-like acetyl esterase